MLNRIVYLSKSKGTVYVLLGMVSERTDFLFIYDSKVVDNERLVKIEKGSRTLRQAITEIVGTSCGWQSYLNQCSGEERTSDGTGR